MAFFWILVIFFVVYLIYKSRQKKERFVINWPPHAERVPERKEEILPYSKKTYFFSLAERRFYEALKQVADKNKWVIFPKVRMRDVFKIYSKPHSKEMFIQNSKIVQKHVDFLLCETGNFCPIVGIELDDSSHNTLERIERDEFVDKVFDSADLPIVRVRVLPEYNLDILEQGILKNINND